MKVSELKELLKKYEPDTQLVVALWDKECFKALDTEERLLTDNEWDYVAKNFSVQAHDQMLGASIRGVLENKMNSTNEATELFIADFMETYLAGTTEEQLWDTE
jgi:hypothetical protein